MRKFASSRAYDLLLDIAKFTRQSYKLIRTQKLTTRIFGPQYVRNLKLIDIDITYACNLRCPGCHRSCSQAPTNEHMSVEQIKRFIEESISNNIKWEKIKIAGGEPTLHPQLFEIVNHLMNYGEDFSPKTKIIVVTNGCGKKVNEVLSRLPEEIVIRNSKKAPVIHPEFYAFNLAPIDSRIYKNVDYSNGCKITSNCGVGLTPYGYYPCAVSGGIDRIFGFDSGRKRLPCPDDLMQDQLRAFCKLCGMFTCNRLKEPEEFSPSWKEAYQRYRMKKPVLTRYGG